MFLREVMGEAVRSRAPGKLGGKEEEAHRPTALCPLPPQPKPTKGRMRIHCLENVDKALQFLKEQSGLLTCVVWRCDTEGQTPLGAGVPL